MKTIAMVVGAVLVLIVIIWGFIFFTSAPGQPTPQATSTPETSTTVTGPTNTLDNTQAPTAPYVLTGNVVSPTNTTAVVSGTVNPNGAATGYWYEYGTTVNLGNKSVSQSVGSGHISTGAPMYITGLVKDTNYFYRVVASNQYGTTEGETHSFKTTLNVPAPVGSVPVAKTLAATSVSRTSSDMRGEVTPNKSVTQYWFEYGTTSGLGNTTTIVSGGSGSAKVPVSTVISNLNSGTTYYFRLNAQNQFGTVNGATLTFKTSGTPVVSVVAPVVTTQVASPITTTTATVRGTVNSNSPDTSYWFEYSTNSNFTSNQTKTTTKRAAGDITTTLSVEANITGLKSGTTYYYRTVAQNSSDTVRGNTLTLKTK